jgi:hypothetical protein
MWYLLSPRFIYRSACLYNLVLISFFASSSDKTYIIIIQLPMTNAFSVLSLKRNRSTSTTHTKANSYSEPISKLSKLKSGFSIFSKITDVLQPTNYEQRENKRTWIGLLRYFRTSTEKDDQHNRRLRRKATYDSDSYYEYHHYRKKNRQKIERNIHTLPRTHTKKLTGILIKQSDTNPPQQTSQPQLTKINSRRSNATHISVSNLTVNSENLTAKEFADIAGIRILPEVEDDPMDGCSSKFTEDMHTRTVSTAKSFLDDDSVISCISIQESKPKIWDNEFWQNPENNHQLVSRNNSTMTRRSSKPTNAVVVEPPILHELRRMSTRNNEDPQHCVIKKGRFEVQLGDMTTNNTDQQIDGVLEWKRKRKD